MSFKKLHLPTSIIFPSYEQKLPYKVASRYPYVTEEAIELNGNPVSIDMTRVSLVLEDKEAIELNASVVEVNMYKLIKFYTHTEENAIELGHTPIEINMTKIVFSSENNKEAISLTYNPTYINMTKVVLSHIVKERIRPHSVVELDATPIELNMRKV